MEERIALSLSNKGFTLDISVPLTLIITCKIMNNELVLQLLTTTKYYAMGLKPNTGDGEHHF